MRLPISKSRIVFYIFGALATVAVFGALSRVVPNTLAEERMERTEQAEQQEPQETSTPENIATHYVTIHDENSKLTVKTDAITVREALERAGFQVDSADRVEPELTAQILEDNFHINIYRARPALILDGTTKKYVMTSSYDPKTIAEDAGLTIYDGDEIAPVKNTQFLEAGDASTYKITRNGGRTITVETPIAYAEETTEDKELDEGAEEVRQVGEEGTTTSVYEVNFVDGVEVSRELVSEEVTKEPVNKITAVGSKKAVTVSNVPPEWETCAGWARQAGVSEADLYSALTLIYHESGCRVNASNPSGAYGIPQALPGSKMAEFGSDWQTNPVTQIKWMAKYVKGRYGGWQQAMAYWWANHWY